MGQSMGQPKTLTTGTTNGTIKCGQPKTLVKWDIQRDNQIRMTEDISQMGHSTGQSNGTFKCGQPKTFNGTIKRDTLVTVLSFCKLKVKIFKRKKIFYSLMNSKDIIRYSFYNTIFLLY